MMDCVNGLERVGSLPPIMSQEQFSLLVGVSKDTVRGWVENATIPSIKMGRQRFINLIDLVHAIRNGKKTFSRGDFRDLSVD